MAHLEIRLLGRPVVLLDGVAVPPPKGAKAWGLLAYLAASDRPRPRSELAELLFGEADDPLGALRWNLAALRRLLDRPDALKGDSIGLDLPDAEIDTRRLDAGDPVLAEGGASPELLAGLTFLGSPMFELWLDAERHRLRRLATSMLREFALRSLARGDHDIAIRAATDLVSIDPLDEGYHALLIRAHTVGGDPEGAQAHFERCRSLLRRELATEPGAAVMAAAHLATAVTEAARPGDVRAIDARMTVAWQSFLGGAVDHGIDLCRSVVVLADRNDDVLLQITARLFLGSMLNIAVRGWDESATVTTEALHLAEQAGLPFEEAMAYGILAGSELMRADSLAAVEHATTGAACCDEAGALAVNLTFLAGVEADLGRGEQAIAHAIQAMAAAESSADPIRIVYAAAYTGNALLLGADPIGARPYMERAVDAAASILVLQPWPMAMLAEIEVTAGHLDQAADLANRAGALAATTDIAYQRALAQRALALVDAARGDDLAAIERLTDALGQARRTTGEGYTFHWPVAWILDSLASVSLRTDPLASERWTTALLDHATTIGMHTFVRRAEARLAGRTTAG